MNRRHFLGFVGLGIGTAGGYLGWRRYNSPSIPAGMRVETQHFEKDVLTDSSSRDADFLDWQEEYQTTLDSRDAADRELIEDDAVTRFLTNTEFEQSYLLVVQNGMQSQMKLVLEGISRRADGLHLDISIDSPRSGPDDLRTHSLLVWITDENETLPEDVSVEITGYV